MPSPYRLVVPLLLLALASGVAANAGSGDVRGGVRVAARAEQNAVVWLDASRALASGPVPRVVLTQRNRTFLPHVLAVRVGTTVEFPNEDRVFHNMFSFHDGVPFDLGTYPVGTSKRVVFAEPGISRLYCNIHPNMSGFVVALDSPYFAAASPDGTFVIRAVPPGTYTYHAWRPGGPALTGTVVVPSISDAVCVARHDV